MQTWLWTIGIVAVVWPVVVALIVDSVFTKWINVVAKRSENSHFADLRAQEFRQEISKLQKVVEQQDALIALLWYRTFGQTQPDSPYVGRGDLITYFGQRPPWYADAMEYPGEFDTLCRYDAFPWGERAEWLRHQ